MESPDVETENTMLREKVEQLQQQAAELKAQLASFNGAKPKSPAEMDSAGWLRALLGEEADTFKLPEKPIADDIQFVLQELFKFARHVDEHLADNNGDSLQSIVRSMLEKKGGSSRAQVSQKIQQLLDGLINRTYSGWRVAIEDWAKEHLRDYSPTAIQKEARVKPLAMELSFGKLKCWDRYVSQYGNLHPLFIRQAIEARLKSVPTESK